MCGISGSVGVTDPAKKLLLTWALGAGIDKRGGDAVGYVSVTPHKLNVGKKLGYWVNANYRFIESAAKGTVIMQHARFATCGQKVITEAHPFVIKRTNAEGKTHTVLYGCHNGMVYNADESALKHGRNVTVDSEEIFELLADNNIDGINKLEGYGVITYINANDPFAVNMIRLSSNSEIYIVELKDGGFAWASTKAIMNDALKLADMKASRSFKVDEIGRMYQITEEGVFTSEIKGVKFDNRPRVVSYNKNKFPYGYGSGAYGFDWENWEEEYEKMQGRQFDSQRGNDVTAIQVYDGGKDRGQEFDIETYAKDIPDLVCEQCETPVDEDEADQYTYLFEQMYGERDTPILCEKCLYSYTPTMYARMDAE